jgi:hypothetical protein
MDKFLIMSEDKIRRAYENGEFDNLPGFGKPLQLDDMSGVPEELRMAYKLMKNAGFSPEENIIKQEMMSIERLMKQTDNLAEREELQKKLNQKLLRFNQMISKKGLKTNSSVFKNYEQKIEKKIF